MAYTSNLSIRINILADDMLMVTGNAICADRHRFTRQCETRSGNTTRRLPIKLEYLEFEVCAGHWSFNAS